MIPHILIMLSLACMNLPFMTRKSKHSWINFISFGFTLGLLTNYLISNL